MARFHRLSTRLVLAMLVPLATLLLTATLFENHYEREAMIEMAETGAVNLSQSVVEELQGILRSTRSALDGVSIPLSKVPVLDDAAIEFLLVSTIEAFPLIFGSAIAMDPEVNGEHLPVIAYFHREGDAIVNSYLQSSGYRYWERPGFIEPMTTGEGIWINPYFDSATGKVRMVTYSRPISIAGRKGVMSVDLRLRFLSDLMDANVLGQNGSVIVFGPDGSIVAHPQKDWILKRTLSDLAEQQTVPGLAVAVDAVSKRETFWLRPDDGMHEGVVGGSSSEPGRMYVRPLNEAGWGVAIYFSDRAFLADIDLSTRIKLALAFVLLMLLALMLWALSFRGLRPLTELAERTRAIARGDFDAPQVAAKRQDEVGRLSRAFNAMQEHLQHYITDLTKVTAERERMAGELATAAQIQHMLLPAEQPQDADLLLRIVASLRPAAEVGGDLYYYKLMSGHRLLFAIGDVSDKGVPAALFMARAMSVLKAASVQHLSPARILDAVNQSLVEDNDLCMFVTLLVGELSLDTGKCKIASAGHENPIKINHEGVQTLQVATGMPVGLEEDQQYQETILTLASDDYLFVYTDGITEARDRKGELFGDQRLHESLKVSSSGLPGEVLEHTLEIVDGFVGKAKQSDDMTMLVLKCRALNRDRQLPDSMTGTVTYLPVPGCQNQLFSDLVSAIEATPFDIDAPDSLQLVVEELVTNVEKYAGLEATDECRVIWTVTGSMMEFHFEDPGEAVDPLKTYTPAVGDERAGGGMGLELIKALTDGVSYSRVDGWNRMTVWFDKQD